jgi:preprotein translocase subunit YajC
MSSSSPAFIFAQAASAASTTNAVTSVPAASDAAAPQGAPAWTNFLIFGLLLAMVYFGLLRPQSLAKKKAEETIKGAKTGDKIVTSSGIHGLITNVKDTTVIVKVADNVKIEMEKSAVTNVLKSAEGAAS